MSHQINTNFVELQFEAFENGDAQAIIRLRNAGFEKEAKELETIEY